MALQMVDDPQDQEEYNDNSGNTGAPRNRAGGGLLSLLPMLFGLFGRGGGKGGGKGGLLILLLIASGAYLLFNQGGCGGEAVSNIAQNIFSQSGYSYDPEQFRQASVYEGLEDNNNKNPLPEAVSLAAYAPPRMNQGKQGSCVAWSAAYAARTILEASASKENPAALAYSPAFMYNNIALEDCQGSYLLNAMKFMQKAGALSYQDFPYNENDCSRQATNTLYEKAAKNKIHGFQRLTETDDINGINIRAIKEHLSKDAPVVIGMMVGGSFMQGMMGQKVWQPTREDRQQAGFGGHAMCVIGYNDRIQGGAFEIMNSWGPEWGENGIGFVRYADFKEFVREAYGIDPLPKKGAALNAPMECLVGLVSNETRQNIALKPAGNN
ncbi:MAG: C1 family peptidase, partial [Ferruginibacter sp.]